MVLLVMAVIIALDLVVVSAVMVIGSRHEVAHITPETSKVINFLTASNHERYPVEEIVLTESAIEEVDMETVDDYTKEEFKEEIENSEEDIFMEDKVVEPNGDDEIFDGDVKVIPDDESED
jgi:hypothetical protein